MLTLTPNATNVIKSLTDVPDAPDNAGLRIAPREPAGTTNDELDVSMAREPAGTDEVVENEGARVFVESNAAQMLDQMELDAQIDESGGVQFTLAPQGGTPIG